MRRLIKTFEFPEEVRRDVTLSAGARLNPATSRIELVPSAVGTFDTAVQGVITTWVANPECAKQWLGFQTIEVHPRDENNEIQTAILYAIGNGVARYHWDGSAWVSPSVLWNTEAEIAANIATFPITEQTLQVFANLSTGDSHLTPALVAIKILYASDIVFQEDLIYRSLIRSLRESIRPVADWPVKMPATADTVDLSAFKLDTPYDLTEYVAAYNHDADPKHFTNLFSSYDAGTSVLTLSSSVPADATLWLQFEYRPEVMVHTSRDYLEIGKVPAIVLSDVNISSTFEPAGDDHVVLNKTTGAAVKVPGPKQHDFDFTLRFLTDKARDLHRLQEATREWIRANPLLRSRGNDERYSLQILNHFDGQGVSNGAEVHAARIRLRVLKVLFYDRPDEDAFAAVRFTLRGPPNVIVS